VRLKTKIFEMNHYKNLAELAQAMKISVSQIYRVQEGKRRINEKFIIGAMRAFPGHRLDDLFYLDPVPPTPATNQATNDRQRIESARRALERLTASIDTYGQPLKSRTGATMSLNEASQEMRKVQRELNEAPTR